MTCAWLAHPFTQSSLMARLWRSQVRASMQTCKAATGNRGWVRQKWRGACGSWVAKAGAVNISRLLTFTSTPNPPDRAS